MALHDLYHGAEAVKMLYNIRNRSLTADSGGKLYFAEYEWAGCLQHGADLQTGESYAAKFTVDIPDGAPFELVPKPGNRDARILTIAPGATVRAELLELYVRRGRAGDFEVSTIAKAAAEGYLKARLAAGRR